VGQGLLIMEASWSHSDTPQSVRLFWKSDQPDAKNFTWEFTTLTRDIHAAGGIRTRNPSKQASGRRTTPYNTRPPGSAGNITCRNMSSCWRNYKILLLLSSQSSSSINKAQGYVPQMKLQHNLLTHQGWSSDKFVSKWQLPFQFLSFRLPRPPTTYLGSEYSL